LINYFCVVILIQALKRSSYASKEEDELNSILTKEISTQTFTPGVSLYFDLLFDAVLE